MFDLGFTEILVIGVVALVVLGPEKMPEVARAAGRFFAKVQGYITQVKGEFERESQLSEIKKLREEFTSSAEGLRRSVTEVQTTLTQEANDVNHALDDLTSRDNQKTETPDPYTQFNQAESTLVASQTPNSPSPFSWETDPTSSDAYRSQYVPRRYKPSPSLDDVIAELEELRREMALPRKTLGGYNRRYAPRARVNRPRIYR
ncbi:MAG TPA: twin-arginine translocase subunit TatB [Candidatus Aphodousia faecavium]|nr:twin-arginine translocase subunit TatB [Candidatus Aphodousia faecavium]